MVGEYQVKEQKGMYFLVNDDRVLKLNSKKRVNLKASSLFLTSSKGSYISSLYATDDIIQSLQRNLLDGLYMADFNKIKYGFYFTNGTCRISTTSRVKKQ